MCSVKQLDTGVIRYMKWAHTVLESVYFVTIVTVNVKSNMAACSWISLVSGECVRVRHLTDLLLAVGRMRTPPAV